MVVVEKKYSKMKDKYKKKGGVSEVSYVPKSQTVSEVTYAPKGEEREERDREDPMMMKASSKVYKDSSHYHNKQKYGKRKNH